MNEKRCSICEQTKSLELFEVEKRNKDGRGARCRPCKNTFTDPLPYKAFWRLKARQVKYPVTVETSKEEVAELFDLWADICFYCATNMQGTPSMDHVIPLVRGGRNHISNLFTCCRSCNAKKGDKPVALFLQENGNFHETVLNAIYERATYSTGMTREEVEAVFMRDYDAYMTERAVL